MSVCINVFSGIGLLWLIYGIHLATKTCPFHEVLLVGHSVDHCCCHCVPSKHRLAWGPQCQDPAPKTRLCLEHAHLSTSPVPEQIRSVGGFPCLSRDRSDSMWLTQPVAPAGMGGLEPAVRRARLGSQVSGVIGSSDFSPDSWCSGQEPGLLRHESL